MSDEKSTRIPMTKEDASRVQSHADRTGTNQDCKDRAQRAAERNSKDSPQGSGSNGRPGGKKR